MRPEITVIRNMLSCATQPNKNNVSLECFGCPGFSAWKRDGAQFVPVRKNGELYGNYRIECTSYNISKYTAIFLLKLMQDGDDDAFDFFRSLVVSNLDDVFDFICEKTDNAYGEEWDS